jgi:hypothetical protein
MTRSETSTRAPCGTALKKYCRQMKTPRDGCAARTASGSNSLASRIVRPARSSSNAPLTSTPERSPAMSTRLRETLPAASPRRCQPKTKEGRNALRPPQTHPPARPAAPPRTQRRQRRVLRQHNLEPSMSRRGNCHDYAVAESFFQLFKRERIRRRTYGHTQTFSPSVHRMSCERFLKA